MEIITPKSATALKTDVHLSVIYSTRPVRADKVNLACCPPFLALDCSPGHFRIPERLDDAAWLLTPYAPVTAKYLSTCVFACVWAMKREKRAEVRNCQAQKATNFCT